MSNTPQPVTNKVHKPNKGARKAKPVQMAVDLAFKALISKGYSIRKASAILGISPTTGMRTLKRLRAQGEEVSGLVSVARDEKTAKLIDHFLDKGLRMKEIKGSDALGAAKIYADRRWPVRKAAPEIPRLNFALVNVDVIRLNQYDDSPGAPSTTEPLDVTPAAGPASTPTGSGSQPPGS